MGLEVDRAGRMDGKVTSQSTWDLGGVLENLLRQGLCCTLLAIPSTWLAVCALGAPGSGVSGNERLCQSQPTVDWLLWEQA